MVNILKVLNVRTWLKENHDMIMELFKVIPFQFHGTPKLCQAIHDEDFESFRDALYDGTYRLSYPMFPEDRPRKMIKTEDSNLRYAEYCEEFKPKYTGSCLEFMIHNDFPIKWLALAYRRWDEECYRTCDRCKDLWNIERLDFGTLVWPFVRAVWRKDLDTFLEWKDHIGDHVYRHRAGDMINVYNYILKKDYSSEWK